MDLAAKWPLRFQISHTGSMTGFGQLKEVLALIDKARASGSDVTFDCYPYDAFCTDLGSAVLTPVLKKDGAREKRPLKLQAVKTAAGGLTRKVFLKG